MTDSPARAPAGTPSVGLGRIRGFAVAAIAVVGHPVGSAALVIMLALVTATSAAYTVDPQGLGGLVYGIVAIGLILIIIAGPVARGARPLRVWIWQIFGATFLLLSLFARMVPFSIGPLRYIDIAYFSGYACLIVWLATMARHIGEPTSRITVLDSAAVAVGVSLAVWTTTLAPLVGASHLPSALVWAVYPILDAVLLALAGHHAYRIGAKIPAMRWLLGALAFLLAVDIVNSSLGILYAVEEQPAVTGAYLFFFVFLTKAATHPSVVELSRPSTIRRTRRVGHRRTALILFVISPAIVASAVPAAGVVDIVVRTALVAVLLALLFARLSTAMGALARAESDSRHRAMHDQLTGLLNRAAMFAALAELLEMNAERGQRTAVLFLDCDEFKYVNDTWGHHAGDRLLRHIARHLPATLNAYDVLARHGGDEFVILTTVYDDAQAVELAERVRRFFDTPIPLLVDRVHAVTPSIGVAVAAPGEAVTTEELLGRADAAMYEAKHRGRAQYAVYDDELARRARLRSLVGDRLGHAVAAEVLGLELQPIMRGAAFETIVGWEALARWHDPELGNVPPDVFVPLAEQLGLIGDFGDVVLRRACQELAALREALGRDDLAIFVNVSPAQLLQPDFADAVRDARAAAGLPPGCLWLEVTETLVVDREPAVLSTLARLRAAGERVCLDDFGTGYASLATLLRLPVDCVKLDRSVVGRLGVDAEAPKQLRAIIDLVHSLGIDQVVAEGVETPEQEALLRQLDCPMAQGWLYGRPATREAILSALGVLTKWALHKTGCSKPLTLVGASRSG